MFFDDAVCHAIFAGEVGCASPELTWSILKGRLGIVKGPGGPLRLADRGYRRQVKKCPTELQFYSLAFWAIASLRSKG